MDAERKKVFLSYARWFTRRYFCMAAGVWVATLLVADFHLTPGVLPIAAATAVLTVLLLLIPVQLLLRLAFVRNLRSMNDERFMDGSDWQFFAPFRRHIYLMAVQLFSRVALLLTAAPLGLWAGVETARTAGLDARLDGLTNIVAAGLIAASVSQILMLVTTLVRRRSRVVLSILAQVLLNAAGLTLAVLLLGAVRLGDDAWWRQATTLLVAAVMVQCVPRFTFTSTTFGLVGACIVATSLLLLWGVGHVTRQLDPALRIDGFPALAGTVLIMWAVEWPGRLAERRARPPTTPVYEDPFPPDQHFPEPWQFR